MIQQEVAEETKTEVSDLDEGEKVLSSGEEIPPDDDSDSIELVLSSQLSSMSHRPSLSVRTEAQREGRRHSVPLSVSKPLTLPTRATARRESLPNDNNKPKNPLLKLDEQTRHGRSSLSLFSSKSSLLGSSGSSADRPVSAENLLPEPSIASITSSTEASRISSVLQPDIQKTQQKQLTRQQTFPPIQPYIRTR